jgi:hypothetical protein
MQPKGGKNVPRKLSDLDEAANYEPLATEVSQRADVFLEEFPEGPYGSFNESRLGKTTPWMEGQHPAPQFSYENRIGHAGEPRDFPGAHPLHDEVDSPDADAHPESDL